MKTKHPTDLLALKEELKQEEQSKSLLDLDDSRSAEEIAAYQKAEREINIERIRIENDGLRQKLAIQKEVHDLEKQRLFLENRTRDLENEGHQQDTQERKRYAKRIFWMLCVWLSIVLTAILISGLTVLDFHLSDTILMALIGSTTANIAGFFFAVVKYLFPERTNHSPKEK